MRSDSCLRLTALCTVVSVCTNNGCANGVDEMGMPVNVDVCMYAMCSSIASAVLSKMSELAAQPAAEPPG